MTPALLDPLRFPLQGNALIEASAGTGKTFTIAALYLRLVLGHGGDAAFQRPLTPPEILVVTFTEAATKELRDRIRARLAQAADAFGGAAVERDPPLRALRAGYAPAEWPACAQRLRLAAEWMDEAAVSTIHGWCNRMLREHAFDSGSLFSQTLEADQTELEQEAVRDYWRTFFYPLPAQDAECVAGWWKTPDALRSALRKLLAQADRMAAAPEPAVALRDARAARAEQLAGLRAPWPSWCDALQALLDEATAARKVNGARLKKLHYDGWLQQLRDWCAGAQPVPLLSDAAWKRLTHAGLREAWRVPDEAPRHEALEALERLREQLACLPECKDSVLAHAARWVAARMASEQARRAEMGFDDLLTRLRDALRRPDSGARLAALIRRQFPVALIDEFQDTDPVQYEIFRTVYQDRGETALILIGDPKQAIYAFRGADIHTYLQARRDTAGHHTTLGTNYRSTHEMVDAVNHLFLQAEDRAAGRGAFLFRSAGDNPLPFLPVAAHGREQRWRVAGADAPALTCWWLDGGHALGPGKLRESVAAATATEIVRLLRLAQQGQAGFVDDKRRLQRLCPRDIAVLVNDGSEAHAVRQALAERSVRSVYLSDRDNVFCSEAAGELQRLLQACAAPEEGGLVRAALATGLLAQDWAALDRLNHDEVHWEERLDQFRGYRARWQRQGVLPMLRRLLHDFEVPQRLIAQENERLLTDLLHLAELLQQASMLLDGEHALVRWLAEQRAEGTMAVDHRQLRLESDADLLKVVTVHKSKGLEYPLVFVPFPCACRPVKAEDVPIKWHDDAGELHLALRPDEAVLARAERERLGEDLRKLYVAMTRARFATWIAVAPTHDLDRTALGYLLAGGEPIAPGQVQGRVEAALASCTAIAVLPAPQPVADIYRPDAPPLQLALPRPLPDHAPEPWWIASYSRLRRSAQAVPRMVETAQEETWLESAQEGSAEAAGDGAAGTLHGFPRGPAAGSFLHGLLEAAAREGFAAIADAPAEIERLLERHCRPARWAPHRAALNQWLARWLATPLDLGRLTPGTRPVAPRALPAIQVEMEFWLAATRVQAQVLDALVCRHTLAGAPRAALEPQQLHGMLKGFMDLVFEHEGRFYVADYKSNWLGPDDAAYTAAAMRDEVLHHRYELQYSLYLFALHRLLRARLPDYDYERHVGGAVYVFLRGHAAPSQGLHLERPPAVLMDELDRLFSAGSGMNAALHSPAACLRLLQDWVAAGWLRELDAVFAAFLAREAPQAEPLALLGAALASHQLGRGHVALDLAAVAKDAGEALAIPPEDPAAAAEPAAPAPAAVLQGVTLADWQRALADPLLVARGEGNTPLVLEGTRLLLRRFWQHEQSVRAGIQQRLAATDAWRAPALASARIALAELFRRQGPAPATDWQKIACAVALRARFSIVTGGPGTGKTTTVVRLLALLQHLALAGQDGAPRRLRIRLAAPTGKAAARLQASIASAVEGLQLGPLGNGEAVRQAIPTDVSTVHRLLGSFGGTRRFRHDAGNPLPLDVLVLDEASMVDLETMAAVIAALPPRARLVLLGDKDQLASVEAGNVLGELCARADAGHYRPETRAWLEALTGERIPQDLVDPHGEPLDQGVVKLRQSWRFGADSGIGRLADAVNDGDAARARSILLARRADLEWLELDARDAVLRRLVLEGHRHYLERVAQRPQAQAPRPQFDAWAHTVLTAYGSFQLLCAVRRGPYGVEGLNTRIAALLHAEKLTPAASGWYAGRPVMVTRNDYALGLMNGDVGIALPLPLADDPQRTLLRVAFEASDGGIRWILPSRLPDVETVFAMTVHKSQGSEFGHAALLLPQEASRVLTRELVYTGITRARSRFTLALPAGAGQVLEQALARRTRAGGEGPRVAGPHSPGGVRP